MSEIVDILHELIRARGGQRRPSQEQMVELVEEALEKNSHLLVQAGTGTGKSFAYLLPAMRYALAKNARVVVATATLPLQRQIMTNDAPAVADIVEKVDGVRPSYAVLKGWNHYVCLHKIQGSIADDEAALITTDQARFGTTATGEEVARVRLWAQATTTGDRDELVPGVSERAWRAVSVSTKECLGRKCPLRSECFAKLAREEASHADVVVTNHAMLGVEAGGIPVLPEYDGLIIDEAHDLVDSITRHLTVTLSPAEVAAQSRMLAKIGVDGKRCEAAAELLREQLSIFDEEGEEFLTELPEDIEAAVGTVLSVVNDMHALIAEDTGGSDEAQAELLRVRSSLEDVAAVATQILRKDVNYALWVSRGAISSAPLDAAEKLARGLYDQRGVVLTSATLKVGESFNATAHHVGLTLPGLVPWTGVDVGSPFDYASQATLYLADSLPEPRGSGLSDECYEELLRLVEASNGGALCLFSSHAAAERGAELLREHLDVPVYYQRDDQVSTLIAQFREDPRACLCGTRTLWQGVDVPGLTNRLVVIARIPFPRPNEPLVLARTERAKVQRRNPFMEVSLIPATLLMSQGVGRLIRSMDDRGVVAVLDSRLRSKKYGWEITRSLPPMRRTTNSQQVYQLLRDLADEAAAEAGSEA